MAGLGAGGAELGAVDFINDSTWTLLTSEGSAWNGSPQPRVTEIPSALLDGTIVVHESDDNRTVTFSVAWGLKNSAESRAMAAARVEYELGRRNLFTYTPLNGEPPAVYWVLDSSWVYVSDDVDERNDVGKWTVSLTCLPFVFSATPVSDDALLGTGAAAVVMDAGTSASGWTSRFYDGATPRPVTSSGGKLLMPTNRTYDVATGKSLIWVSATKTFAATDFSSTPFVCFDVDLGPNAELSSIRSSWTRDDTGASVWSPDTGTYVGATPSTTSGFTTLWFYLSNPGTARTTYLLDFVFLGGASDPIPVDNLTRTGSAPYLPGAQTVTSLRHIDVTGSRRTPGSLAVDLKDGGGWLVYTGPSLGVGGAYNPQILTTPASFSGSKSITVPVAGLPRGGYLIVADMSGQVNGTQTVGKPITLKWTASQSGAVSQSGAQVYDTTSDGTVASFARRMSTISPVVLPVGDVDAGSGATMTLTFTAGGSPACTFTLNAVFLLYMGPGAALTMGDATTPRYVFINSATIDRPWPQVLAGSAADGSDAVSQIGALRSTMRHIFTPPVQAIVVYSGGATTAPTASLVHTPCWGDWPGTT